MLNGLTIAVTGSSGFIGGRIVDYLALATEARVRALVRSYSRLSRLADLPQARVTFHCADLRDEEALRSSLAGCDVVIHCAFGNSGTVDEQARVTIDGARNIVNVATDLGVRRIVYLSTAAIHDFAQARVLDENAPRLTAPETSYEGAKQTAEDLVLRLRPDAIALRPTVVYGPWGRDWTTVPLERLAAGVRLPTSDAPGISNAVFVDDVARAAVRSCTANASGPFIIAALEPVGWGRFYDAFRRLMARPPAAATAEIEEWEQQLYSATCRAEIGRAQQLLGYQPNVAFESGMDRIAVWDRWFRRRETSRHGAGGCPGGC